MLLTLLVDSLMPTFKLLLLFFSCTFNLSDPKAPECSWRWWLDSFYCLCQRNTCPRYDLLNSKVYEPCILCWATTTWIVFDCVNNSWLVTREFRCLPPFCEEGCAFGTAPKGRCVFSSCYVNQLIGFWH